MVDGAVFVQDGLTMSSQSIQQIEGVKMARRQGLAEMGEDEWIVPEVIQEEEWEGEALFDPLVLNDIEVGQYGITWRISGDVLFCFSCFSPLKIETEQIGLA